MVKKVVDSRIPTLIRNGVQNKHRSFFVIVGDKGKDQVVNLHWLLSQAQITARPTVLWCYKKELGFTSHRKKREAKIRKEIKRGIREANEEDPFELFIAVTNIRYTYYKETHNILGNTYGMCILQDFEALTPNLLARTIETVEGGGIVVILLKTMKSLKQLYTLTMDVHSRYRTEAHDDVTARFNERFILSLGSCESCLVVDDELNVLPISAGKNVKPLPSKPSEESMSDQQIELKELKASLADKQPVGLLVATAKTLDQGKAILTFIDAISEKKLRSTVTLTASRGRGKSAALGIAIAAAVAYGYSNIFVTSPSPENLKTLFEFIFRGFDALEYEEHLDYDIIQSTNPDFNKAIVRVNIFKQHRQTIQDAHVLGQAELLIIDEAAAIPLPLVKNLIGPYLVFMASTINGYEGTGRSLSLKLIQQLREQSRGFVGQENRAEPDDDVTVINRNGKTKKDVFTSFNGALTGGRILREIKLEEPIRYGPNDPVEQWLNKLLCLDATIISKNIQGCPHPQQCELYWVNRDTLFSFHPVSELFLQRMMALYVASHYKNSPNDLQLMSDAPAHHLFVLLPPIKGDNSLPDPLCVVQVCLEGDISKQAVLNSLKRGQRASGDLIPWLISQQFQDDDFASLSGARIVRIATHPDYMKMGYGSRCLELLNAFYQGEFSTLKENEDYAEETMVRVDDSELENADLHKDEIKIRDPHKMPPLLLKLSEKRPVLLNYLGVSYGLTSSLHKFWKRAEFIPLYLRQTPNDLTGEHTCVMLKVLKSDGLITTCSQEWLAAFSKDFHKRFLNLLSYQFRNFPSILSLSIMETADAGFEKINNKEKKFTKDMLDSQFSVYDLKRLESYSNNLLDYHIILDLIPTIAHLYFEKQFGKEVVLSGVQSSILLGIGLQKKSIDDLEKELTLPAAQVLALFMKIIRKFSTYFRSLELSAIQEEIPHETTVIKKKVAATKVATTAIDAAEENITNPQIDDDAAWDPVSKTLSEDLDEAGDEVMKQLKEKQRELIDSLDLSKYAIGGSAEGWEAAESQIKALTLGKKSNLTVVSVKNPDSTKKRKITETAANIVNQETKMTKNKRKKS
ncbi:310_t:CDS:10, partial [Gigaspora margarita]